nr:MAG TPA: hypothetical protein [Caudoviricetes sp.]
MLYCFILFLFYIGLLSLEEGLSLLSFFHSLTRFILCSLSLHLVHSIFF